MAKHTQPWEEQDAAEDGDDQRAGRFLFSLRDIREILQGWGCFGSSQELLQSISTLRVEDWETDSLQIVEREQIITAFISAGTPSLLEVSEGELGDVQETHPQAALPALVGGYTTMEMFRQAVPANQEGEPDVTMRSQQDYVRQFSTDSTCDNRALQ